MSLEYSDRICPFWRVSLYGHFKCLLQCSTTKEFCSLNYAKDRFLNCIEYLSQVQKMVAKHKKAIKGG